MIRFFKYLIIAILSIIGVVIAFSVAAIIVYARYGPDCSGNSESAKYIRSLNSERLSKLYGDMERFYQMEQTPDDQRYGIYDGVEKPEEFADLKVNSIRPKEAQIMVIGCLDNFMYLHFNGIKNPAEKEIILQYGEHEITTEKIWPK